MPLFSRLASAGDGTGMMERGSLKGFMGLPVDIMDNISSNADPRALMQLSRVNNKLHTLIVKENRVGHWENSVAAAGLPPRPAHIKTAMEYVLTMFEDKCRGEGCNAKADARDLIVAFPVRYCADCRPKYLITDGQLFKQGPGLLPREVASTIPYGYPRGSTRHVWLKSDYDSIQKRYWEERPLWKGDPKKPDDTFVTAFIRELNIERKAKWEVSKKLIEWVQQDRKRVQGVMNWRRNDIESKILCHPKYTPDDIPKFNHPEWRKYVYQPRHLTPLEWRKIRGKLFRILDAFKKKHQSTRPPRNRPKSVKRENGKGVRRPKRVNKTLGKGAAKPVKEEIKPFKLA